MNKPRYWKPTKRSKNYVPGEIWDNAIAFCRCYPLWVAEYRVCDTPKTITNYSHQVKVQTSGDFNPVEAAAIRRARLKEKMDIVEQAADQACDNAVLRKYLILGVTRGLSYSTLQKQGIPCSRNYYHRLRREMIYHISQNL